MKNLINKAKGSKDVANKGESKNEIEGVRFSLEPQDYRICFIVHRSINIDVNTLSLNSDF